MTSKREDPGILRRLRGSMQRNFPLLITCGEVERFMHDYVAGELTAHTRRTFRLHIRLCRECEEYLNAYERTVELGRAAVDDPDAAVPEDVPEDLMQAILVARDKAH